MDISSCAIGDNNCKTDCQTDNVDDDLSVPENEMPVWVNPIASTSQQRWMDLLSSLPADETSARAILIAECLTENSDAKKKIEQNAQFGADLHTAIVMAIQRQKMLEALKLDPTPFTVKDAIKRGEQMSEIEIYKVAESLKPFAEKVYRLKLKLK